MANETKDMIQIAYHDGYSKGLEFTLSVCLCYTLCVLGLRVYIRWKNFAIDDLIIFLSTAFAFAFFGCGYATIPIGLGRSTQLQKDDITKLNTLTLVSDLSWIIALCLSKLAVIYMLLRTTLDTSHRRLQYLAGSLVTAQCIISITTITANCGLFDGFSRDFRLNNHACSRQELRWRIITGCDIATEIVILILPLQLVWKLQMSPKNKFIAIAAFWLRMPNIIFTILRNNATNNLSSTANISLTAAMVLVWQAIEMSYSVAAATIAALKRWTESLNTGFGHGELIRVHGNSQNYKLSDRSGSSKGSKASKPHTRVSPGQTLQQERVQSPDYQLQELDLRPRHLFDEIEVQSSTNYSRPIVGAAQEVRLDDMNIRQDFRYSVHYDEEPLVPRTQH